MSVVDEFVRIITLAASDDYFRQKEEAKKDEKTMEVLSLSTLKCINCFNELPLHSYRYVFQQQPENVSDGMICEYCHREKVVADNQELMVEAKRLNCEVEQMDDIISELEDELTAMEVENLQLKKEVKVGRREKLREMKRFNKLLHWVQDGIEFGFLA